MTASDFGDAVYSAFTLNVFKGSGWYNPNMNMAQPLSWEYKAGCTTMGGKTKYYILF